MASFEERKKKLNAEQLKAVDTLDGPVMVVAGPGTGKTELLSMRVANILKSTDTDPQNILCLTFTEKAAINMQSRLVELVGAESRRLTIKTFHGFGSELINSYPDYFWNAARLAPAPDAIQIEVIDSILRELPHSNRLALRFAGNPTLTGKAKEAIKQAKENGLTPEKLKAILEHNLSYIDAIEGDMVDALGPRISKRSIIDTIAKTVRALPESDISELISPLQPLSQVIKSSFEQAAEDAQQQEKTKPISEWKSRWLQSIDGIQAMHKERERNQWWLDLTRVYQQYRDKLHQAGYFDYADMIIEVILQLEQSSRLRAEVQERFNYVLIDEFQDTNTAQMRLAHLVADHRSAEGKPNIMVVGDDDQAIYKFQGAQLNNLINFRSDYPSTKLIVLKDNYRSHQSVLDLSKQVIEQAQTRLVTHEKDLNKSIKSVCDAPKGTIEHNSYATDADQYLSVAKQIKKEFGPAKNIAVIARNHASLEKMAGTLDSLGVAVHYEKQNNALQHPLCKQLVLLLKIVQGIKTGNNHDVNALLAESLRHPMWNIPPETLWKIAVKKPLSWLDELRRGKHRWVVNWLDDLVKINSTENTTVLISAILGVDSDPQPIDSPLHAYYVNNSELSSEYLAGLSAIRLLRSLAADLGRSKQMKLEDFLRFVEVHEENNLVLADETPFTTADHAVTLLSVHKAKGLEFDSVYIIDANDNNWSPRNRGSQPPANLPLKPVGDDMDDYIRLMFVALTRAISSITLSSYRSARDGKEILPASIIAGVLPAVTKPASSQQKAIASLETDLAWPRLNTKDERQLLAGRLESYQLNATAVINFLDLEKAGPLKFLEKSLLRIPQAKTPHQSHGTAVHAALELGQKLTNAGKFELDAVVERYRQTLSLENLSRAQAENWLAEGERRLRYLFEELGFKFTPGSLPERKFDGVACGSCLLSGAFDNISETKSSVTIADYKTGKPLNNLSATTKSDGTRAWRHRSQLIFYSLIASQLPRYQNKSIAGEMIYVEAESAKLLRRDYQPTSSETQRMHLLTNAIWSHIKELDFPDTSRYEQTLSGILQFEEDLLNKRI